MHIAVLNCMSDIGLPAGMELFLVSLGGFFLSLALCVGLLGASIFSEKSRKLLRRRSYRLFMGALIPLVLSAAGALLALYAPREWRAEADRIQWYWYLSVIVAGLGGGLLWGACDSRRVRRKDSIKFS